MIALRTRVQLTDPATPRTGTVVGHGVQHFDRDVHIGFPSPLLLVQLDREHGITLPDMYVSTILAHEDSVTVIE